MKIRLEITIPQHVNAHLSSFKERVPTDEEAGTNN